MTIQLSKNGQVVLSAHTDHLPYHVNSFDFLPVTYEGNVSLLEELREEAIAKMIVGEFEHAAVVHDLDISGDYRGCVLRLD